MEQIDRFQDEVALVREVFEMVAKMQAAAPGDFVAKSASEFAALFGADHVVVWMKDGKSAEYYPGQVSPPIVFQDSEINSIYESSPRHVDTALFSAGEKNVVVAVALPLLGGDEADTISGVLYAAKHSHSEHTRLRHGTLPLLCAMASVLPVCIEGASVDEIHLHSLIVFLKQLRAKRKMSLREVAEKSDGIIEQTWLSKAERKILGEIRQQHSRLIALARVYGVQTELLLALAGLEVPPIWRDNQVIDGWLLDALKDRSLLYILKQLQGIPEKSLIILWFSEYLDTGGRGELFPGDSSSASSAQTQVPLPAETDSYAEFTQLLDQVVDAIRREQNGTLDTGYHFELRYKIETMFEQSPAKTVRLLRETLKGGEV